MWASCWARSSFCRLHKPGAREWQKDLYDMHSSAVSGRQYMYHWGLETSEEQHCMWMCMCIWIGERACSYACIWGCVSVYHYLASMVVVCAWGCASGCVFSVCVCVCVYMVAVCARMGVIVLPWKPIAKSINYVCSPPDMTSLYLFSLRNSQLEARSPSWRKRGRSDSSQRIRGIAGTLANKL